MKQPRPTALAAIAFVRANIRRWPDSCHPFSQTDSILYPILPAFSRHCRSWYSILIEVFLFRDGAGWISQYFQVPPLPCARHAPLSSWEMPDGVYGTVQQSRGCVCRGDRDSSVRYAGGLCSKSRAFCYPSWRASLSAHRHD